MCTRPATLPTLSLGWGESMKGKGAPGSSPCLRPLLGIPAGARGGPSRELMCREGYGRIPRVLPSLWGPLLSFLRQKPSSFPHGKDRLSGLLTASRMECTGLAFTWTGIPWTPQIMVSWNSVLRELPRCCMSGQNGRHACGVTVFCPRTCSLVPSDLSYETPVQRRS